jgi:FkbM family methyltransferase
MGRRLIYDVGAHLGEDTNYYLRRGYDVVAIEANPVLVDALRRRFPDERARGQLHIVDKAIAAKPGKVHLGINANWTIWGSLSEEFLERNRAGAGIDFEYIEVTAVAFADVLHEYGVPYYLKVDIEGMDMLCVDALHHFAERPKYLSVETTITAGVADMKKGLNELCLLWSLGYRHFKYVDQAALCHLNGARLDIEGPAIIYEDWGGSGPFGEETPGCWLEIDEAVQRARKLVRYQNTIGWGGRYSAWVIAKVARRLRRYALRLSTHSWYDLHARLGG